MRVSIVFSATMNESGQVPDEHVMELAFAVGNHEQVDVIFSIAVFRGVERKYFVVFEDENVDAYCWVDIFEFGCVRVLERELESRSIQFMHELFIF